MKKLMFLLPLLSLIGLTSCGEDSHLEEVTPLKSKEITTFVDIDSLKLKDLVNSKKEFILFVYQNGCMGCYQAEKYIRRFVEETDIIIYGIHYFEYNKLQNNTLEYPIVSYTPTFFFYEEGEVFSYIDRVYDENSNGYEKFVKMIDERVDLNSKIYSLNKYDFVSMEFENNKVEYNVENYESTETLDEAIKNNNELNVVMSWSKCGDCQSLYKNYIYTDRLNKLENNLYIFEVDHFRDKKPPMPSYDEEAYKFWLDFATKYGFSSYYDGKVPSLVNFKNGKPNEFIVYANEGSSDFENDKHFFKNAQLESVNSLRCDTLEELIEKARELELSEFDRILGLK